jgi:hypothetical protein
MFRLKIEKAIFYFEKLIETDTFAAVLFIADQSF